MSEQTKLRNRILALFYHAGSAGRTDAELSGVLRVAKNVIPCRRRDLELNGLVERTANRRQTDTGSPAFVYVITAKGAEMHNSSQDAPARPRGSGGGSPETGQITTLKGLLRQSRVFLANQQPRPTNLLAEIDKAI